MRTLVLSTIAALACSLGTASADVRVTMASGQVSISAKNATIAQILSEWARVGQTRIINGERLTGAPLTLELSNVPEKQALEILLRGASGYVIAPREILNPEASIFDRILIVPTSNAPRAAVQQAPPTPAFQPAARQPFAPAPEEDTQQAPPNTPRFVAPNTAEPGVQPPPAPPAATGSPTPTSTFGVARPGMMVPVPQPAVRPPAPNQP